MRLSATALHKFPKPFSVRLWLRFLGRHLICLHIFRHLAQKSLDIRQYAFGISVQSDEKSDSASAALALCGIALKRGYDILLMEKGIEMLANQEQLPQKYKDHQLSGDYSDCRECHITPDWLLIYRIVDDELILTLTRTGTHSDLF